MSNEQYDVLIRIAKGKIWDCKRLDQIFPEDIVAEAFIRFGDDYETLKKEIRLLVILEHKKSIRDTSHDSNEKLKVCNKCKETYPSSYFDIRMCSNGNTSFNHCKKCNAEKFRRNYHRNIELRRKQGALRQAKFKAKKKLEKEEAKVIKKILFLKEIYK